LRECLLHARLAAAIRSRKPVVSSAFRKQQEIFINSLYQSVTKEYISKPTFIPEFMRLPGYYIRVRVIPFPGAHNHCPPGTFIPRQRLNQARGMDLHHPRH